MASRCVDRKLPLLSQHSSQGTQLSSNLIPGSVSLMTSVAQVIKRRYSQSSQVIMERLDSVIEDTACRCGKKDSDEFMIQCDGCTKWVHGACVLITSEQAADIEKYFCPNCRYIYGPLTLRNRERFWEKDPSIDSAENIPSRNGSREFVKYLEQRRFDDPSGVPVLTPAGHEVVTDFLEKNCFTCPILVDVKEGLDITVPDPGTMTIEDIEEMIGSMKELDVIDVAEQRERKMLLREWMDYFTTPAEERRMRLNLISLEFSNTRLAKYIDPPAVVKAVSWVDNHWPDMKKIHTTHDAVFVKPEVQKYCLMSVGGSYTDFHVDFGGTSVWYHVLKGEKIFYLIRPTEENLKSFEEWYQSDDQASKFLPNLIDDPCYRCVIKQGQTVFLPSGWIHAVLTPVDSVVFGGNFLNSYSIEMQLRVYALERRTRTPEKYFFPNFETLHWYVAEKIRDLLKRYRLTAQAAASFKMSSASRGGSAASSRCSTAENSRDGFPGSSSENSSDDRSCEDAEDRGKNSVSKSQGSSARRQGAACAPEYLVRGTRILIGALQAWVRIRSQDEQQTIPDCIKSRRLISDLDKLVEYWEGELWGAGPSGPEEESGRRRRKYEGAEEWAERAGYDLNATESSTPAKKKNKKKKPSFVL